MLSKCRLAGLSNAYVYGTFRTNTIHTKIENMDNQKQELIAKLKEANNILVTVSANPSVDQLAACIGLTLFLNKQKKHATAVFSGEVPSTLQFLKPSDTLEKNTDSLRDFIVSLDKTKADKLRYKVEDNVVKIFITPYKTSITEADLDFSQGDFNVDVVLCLGVDKQQDLDQAITSHGRILHDATVASVSTGAVGELGTLNWVEPQASSLSELAAQITDALGRDEMDGQIATSFLTGIVAETDRFSNDKTSPVTMKLSADLMAAGANQQLVASELEAGDASLAINKPPAESNESPDGTLEIGHVPDATPEIVVDESRPPAQAPEPNSYNQAASAQDGVAPLLEGDGQSPGPASRLVLQPPSFGGTLTANSSPESFDPSVDPLSLLSSDTSMLQHGTAQSADTVSAPPAQQSEPVASAPEQSVALPEVQAPAEIPPAEPALADALPDFEPLPSEPTEASTSDKPPAPVETLTNQDGKSLAELEQAVNSPHLGVNTAPPVNVDAARDAVQSAVNAQPYNAERPEPTQASGAEGYLKIQDLPDINDNAAPLTSSPADTPLTMPVPPSLNVPQPDPIPPTSVTNDPTAPPPVPPPLPLDDLSKFTTPNQ